MERKTFLQTSLALVGGSTLPLRLLAKTDNASIRFGIVSDIHYADKKPNIGRYYKQSIEKLRECVGVMNKKKVDFLVELGDFKDNSNPPEEDKTLQYLSTIEKELQQFKGPCYHVLGNHDEDSISKQQFLNRVKNDGFSEAKNYYTFEKKGIRFYVLDANFTSEGIAYNKGNFDWKDCHVPQEQLDWLKEGLENSNSPSVIFIHQRLDRFYSLRHYCPDNSDEVRKILEDSGKVLAVFQGHDHRGGINKINNIPYYTIKAVIQGSGAENNSYAIVEIKKDYGNRYIVKVEGFRKAESVVFT